MTSNKLLTTIEALTYASTEECDIKRENGNINGDTAMATMLRYGSECSKEYVLNRVLPKYIADAHTSGDIHIHDLDFYLLTTTCCQIDLNKLFTRGFNTGHGALREPQSITTAAALTCIAIQSNQNDQHGGQSIPAFDYMLAPYVKKSYLKHYRQARELSYLFTCDDNDWTCEQIAWKETEKETEQAMEALVHNLNTMHCLPEYETMWVMTSDNAIRCLPSKQVYDMVVRGDVVKALSFDTKRGVTDWAPITQAKKSEGSRRIITLRNKLGATVSTTDNHRIITMDDGIAGEAYPEDVNATVTPRCFPNEHAETVAPIIELNHSLSRKTQNYIGDTIEITPEFAWLLGTYVGDGSVVAGSQLCFSVCDDKKADRLARIMKDTYADVSWNEYRRENGLAHDIRFNVGKVWCEAIQQCVGYNSHGKRVPSQILGGDESLRLAFLKGYFQTDGHIYASGATATSVSRELRDGIALLCIQSGERPYYNERTAATNALSDNIMYEISLGKNAAIRLGILDGEPTHTEYPKHERCTRSYYTCDTDVFSETESNVVYDFSVPLYETFVTGEGIVVHNSRAGAQVPFSSINYGTDTSREGRLVTRAILRATEEGMGHHETPIFPIHIFKCMHGVNLDEGDPNYDLFQYALYVSGLRMYPNFSFPNSSFNAPYYQKGRPETEIAYMGCADGQEIITIKANGNISVLDFETAWDRYHTATGVEIYDSSSVGNWTKVKTWVRNEDRGDWYKIKFSNGRILTLTSDHPLPTQRGRILVKDLLLGDRVQKAQLPHEGLVSTPPFDPWLVGFLVCDGCYQGNIMACVGMDEYDLADRVRNIIGDEYVRFHEQHRGTKGDYIEIHIKENPLFNRGVLSELYQGLNKIDRKLPEDFLSWSREDRLSLLAGIIDADGYINTSKGCTIQVGSTNKTLALQQLYLLESLGCAAKFYENKYSKGTDKIRYRVEAEAPHDLSLVSGKKNVRLYARYKAFCRENLAVVEILPLGFRNKYSYDVETESDYFDVSGVVSHNCRTRVIGNVNGEEQVYGRGNLSFTTINLPRLAIEHKDVSSFEDALDKMMVLVRDQLMHRYQLLCKHKQKKSFPFLLGSGVWYESEYLDEDDNIADVFKHGTLSIGFIGLAECVKALCGAYPIENNQADELAENIVKRMREQCDMFTEETGMNFSLLGTPAEGTAGKFVLLDREKYGIIDGVTDRDYYTNSFHVPVWYECSIADKIAHEGKFHKYCNAGHITYVEVDGDASKNIEALEQIVKCAAEQDCGYFAINHPIDFCPVCGFTGVIDDECPKCHRKEYEVPPKYLESGEENPYYG